ncbi:bactericidal permeability-increasing protein-like [Octopus sinensis]|uniref:Bactericidal permeability-increasing protein-like n=1 Tax=Octopus sinensis TaxID=2607531 RepID=A0A7E6EUN0_9MOLL|nr:bactericidal permeability-increasing protein-like [Octopus sinensis]
MLTDVFLSSVILGLFLMKTSSAGDPGVVTRITQKGLDYASTIGFTQLHEQFKSIRKIPNIVHTGDTYYSLTNLYVDKLTKPHGSIAFVPGHGLKWSMTIPNAQISGNWRYSKKLWFFRVGDAGSMKINMPETHVEIIIKLTKTPHGAPDVKATHCSCDIAFDLDTYNWFYNFVIFLFKGTIRTVLRHQMCEKAVALINDNGYEQIINFPLQVPIGYDFILDYRLVNDPLLTTLYMQLEHKAKISWFNDNDLIPFHPGHLPYVSDNGKMIYVVISNYVVDSWSFAAHKHHVLQYVFSSKHLPAAQSELLMTTCSEETICIGKLIPQVWKHFQTVKHWHRCNLLSPSPKDSGLMPIVKIRAGRNYGIDKLVNVVLHKSEPKGSILSRFIQD